MPRRPDGGAWFTDGGATGAPCVQNSDCSALTDFDIPGRCVPGTLPDGGPNLVPGGYCSNNCGPSVPEYECPGATAVCVPWFVIFGNCFATCAQPLSGQSDCRAGYVCDYLLDADGGRAPIPDAGTRGVCVSRCDATLNPCPVHTTCGSDGFCR